MKQLKTLASALCLAFLFTPLLSKAQALVPGQISTTGNIVQDTPQGGPTPWVGGVYQNQLTCWGYGDPGYCGPSPIVRPGGNINFSYGSSYIYQQQHISTLLPSSTGLQVNGYNFGFMAKNGNGWDDGRTDNLTALVRFWDNTNGRGTDNLLYGTSWNLNYKFNWTQFNYNETFTKPLAVPSIGQVQYGFIGSDNNFWAGPYGPEIYNVSFSLKYSVDPCATNILSRPSCPGYLDALAKLAPAPVAPTIVTEVSSPSPMVADSGPNNVSGQPAPPPGSAPPPPGSPPPPEGSQPPPPPGPTPAGAPAQQVASTQPAPGGQQAKAGEVSDSSSGSKSTVSLSSVLNMISSNQDKTSALEKSVVQSADAQAFSAGETAKQQAEKIAGDQQSQSMSAGGGSTSTAQTSGTQSSFTQTQSSMVSLQGNQQPSNASNAARVQQSINSSISSQSNDINFTGTTTQQSSYQSTTRQEVNAPISTSSVTYSLATPTRQSVQPQVEIPMLEGIKFGFKNAVDSAMESRPFVPQINEDTQQASSVKRNVENNELAGNISIESIAKQPANYAQYFVMMPDVAFYAPKEIYRNQKTVDNVRALRQMSSDRLHQQMVDQQYK
jgi:hypothetical protein